MVGKWKVWISGPVLLRFPVNFATTPPTALFDVYAEMCWQHTSPFGMSSAVRNSTSSVCRIVTTHAREGPRRYSIYSQDQACDISYQLPHMMVAWPIMSDTGNEPTPAQKTVALGGHPFWMSKVQQGDFYTLDALPNISPIKVWMRILNSFADAAFSIQTRLALGPFLIMSIQIRGELRMDFSAPGVPMATPLIFRDSLTVLSSLRMWTRL